MHAGQPVALGLIAQLLLERLELLGAALELGVRIRELTVLDARASLSLRASRACSTARSRLSWSSEIS